MDRKRFRRHESGAALLVVLLVIFVLLLLATSFMHKLSAEFRLTDRFFKSISALYLAEAGVELAVWEFNEGALSDWEGTDEERSLLISSFEAADGTDIGDIQVTVFDGEEANPIVESLGRVLLSGDTYVTRKVRVVLERESAFSYFDHAVFGNSEVVLDRNILIDSYDSRLGNYVKQNIQSNGDIGTNSTFTGRIDIGNGTLIKGDVYVGYEGDPESVILLDRNADILGDQRPLSQARPQLSIPAPASLPLRGDYDGSRTISQDGEYDNFILASKSRVTVEGHVTLLVSGAFYMQQGSELRIERNSSLTLFIDGNFQADNNTKFNHLGGGRDPGQLIVFGTEDFRGEIRFGEQTEFYGAVYAPTGDIFLDQSSEFYGALEANAVTLKRGVQFHYDEALEESVSGEGAGSTITVKSWQEKTGTV